MNETDPCGLLHPHQQYQTSISFLLLIKVFPFSNWVHTLLEIILILTSQPVLIKYNHYRKQTDIQNRLSVEKAQAVYGSFIWRYHTKHIRIHTHKLMYTQEYKAMNWTPDKLAMGVLFREGGKEGELDSREAAWGLLRIREIWRGKKKPKADMNNTPMFIFIFNRNKGFIITICTTSVFQSNKGKRLQKIR